MKTSPKEITELKPNEIFVFGSNMRGVHGLGAAKTAHKKFGAQMGIGRGLTGQCYALPTKDLEINTLPLFDIEQEIILFLMVAKENPEKDFLVTAFGTGLAGYTHKDIAKLFRGKDVPDNVFLPKEWVDILE